MAINPLIPLSVSVPNNASNVSVLQQGARDLGQGINTAVQNKRTKDVRKEQSVSERDMAKLRSMATGSLQLKMFLDAGDTEGAMSFLQDRAQKLDEIGIPSDDTQEMMQILSENPEQAIQLADAAIGIGDKLGFFRSGTGEPSAVREFKFFQSLSPEDKSRFLRVKRSDKFLDVGSGFVTPDPANPEQTTEVAKRGLKPTEELGFVGEKKTVEKEAEFAVEKKKLFPKAKDTLTSLNRQWDVVDEMVDKALEQASPFTAGVGAWTRAIPASPAKDLEQTLDTIRANIGFDKLQDMRNNSPTGGALGQVSEFENRLLQAVQGSLQQNQSVPQLKANLERIKENLRLMREQKKEAFQRDFGEIEPQKEKPKRIKVDEQGNVIRN